MLVSYVRMILPPNINWQIEIDKPSETSKMNIELEFSSGLPSKIIVIPIPTSINFHLEINNPEETSKLEAEFAEEVKKRGEDFKYYKDQVPVVAKTIYLQCFPPQFGEHPEERANNEEISEKLSGVTTLNEIYAAIKDKVSRFSFCAFSKSNLKTSERKSHISFGQVPKLEPIRIPMNQEQVTHLFSIIGSYN